MPRAPLPRKAPATPSARAWVVSGAECAITEEASRRNETTASQIPAGVVPWSAAQPSSASPQTAEPAPNAVADRAEVRRLRRAVARRSTAAATKTSSMFCFTAAAATASAPAAIHHHVEARGRPVRRESGGESREHEGDRQDLAVDLGGAEQGRDQEHRSGGGRADHHDPGAAREATVEPERGAGQRCGEEHGRPDARGTEQPQTDRSAGQVGELEQHDQQRRPVHPVVAVQRGALRPLGRDHQEPALVGAERPEHGRHPGKDAERRQEQDGPAVVSLRLHASSRRGDRLGHRVDDRAPEAAGRTSRSMGRVTAGP